MSESYADLPLLDLGARLTLHRVGNSGVALDSVRAALCWIDPQTALFLCALEEGLGEDDIVMRLQEDLDLTADEARHQLAQLIDALDRVTRSGAMPPTPSTAVAPGNPVPRVESDALPTHRCKVSLLGKTVEVCLPTQSLLKEFTSIMGHLQVDDSAASDRSVFVARHGNRYAIVEGDTVVAECASRRTVTTDVKSAVCHAAINAQKYDACLHCAVVEIPGGAAIVPAASGQGKTCLAVALAAAGYACLADDLALVDLQANGLFVRGVPASSCIKRDAWKVVAALHPALENAETLIRADGKIVRYLAVAKPRLEPLPIRAIVIPGFERGANPQASVLSPEVAMQHVLGSALAWRAKLTPQSVDALIHSLQRLPAVRLNYGSPADAVALFEEVVASSVEGERTLELGGA